MPERPAPGRAVATRRAVTDIVRTAVLGCYGVAGFATPNPWDHLVRLLGIGEPGIRLALEDLRVDLRIRVAYGLPVAEVARQVESALRYALSRDLGREPAEVTIHVVGLVQREGTVHGVPEPPAAEDAGAPAAEPATIIEAAAEPTGGPDDAAPALARKADPAEPGGGR